MFTRSVPLVGNKNRELVAAETRHGVRITQQFPQALGNFLQHEIPDRVTEAVVDQLETIEVHDQDRYRSAVALGDLDGLVETVAEHGAVGQAGKRVLVRQAQDLRLALEDALEHVIETFGQVTDFVLLCLLPLSASNRRRGSCERHLPGG